MGFFVIILVIWKYYRTMKLRQRLASLHNHPDVRLCDADVVYVGGVTELAQRRNRGCSGGAGLMMRGGAASSGDDDASFTATGCGNGFSGGGLGPPPYSSTVLGPPPYQGGGPGSSGEAQQQQPIEPPSYQVRGCGWSVVWGWGVSCVVDYYVW